MQKEQLTCKVEMLEGKLREELKKTNLIKNQKDANEKVRQIVTSKCSMILMLTSGIQFIETDFNFFWCDLARTNYFITKPTITRGSYRT